MSIEDQAIQANFYVRQHNASLMIPFSTSMIGLIITGILYINFVKVDNEWVTDRIKRGTDTLVNAINPVMAVPNPLLEQINTTLQELRTNIATEEGITQELLDNHLWEEPFPGLETSTIEYLPRIAFNEALELESRFGDRISDDFEIVKKDNGVISQAPVRDEYYPVLLESANQNWGTVIGEDRALTNPLIKIILEQARDTGEIVSHTFFPLADHGDQTMLSHYYHAIYETGYVPDTIAERREKLSGFVSIVSYYPLQKEFIGFYPESYQGMQILYFPLSGSYQQIEKPREIEREIKTGHILETTYFLHAQEGEPWMALTQANPELISVMETSARWWVLSLGLVFTSWISGLIFWYRKKSTKLLMQVKSNTDTISKKTEIMREMNKDLQEIKERYKMLAENTTNVVFTHDLDGLCTYISPSITRQSGYKAEDYIGRKIMEHLTDASAESLKERLEELKKELAENIDKVESSFMIEYEMICKDGSVKTMKNTVSVQFDDSGTPNSLMGVVNPIPN